MKSSPAFYIGIAIVVSSVLAGCGQPGALYLPKPPAAKPASKGPLEPAPVPPPPTIVPAT